MTCAKVAINGPNLKKLAQKKIKLAKVVAKEKKILARTLKLSCNFVTSSVACCLSLTCIPLFTDYDRVLHVRSDKKMTQECQSALICQDRSAQPQIGKYVSARILMQTLNTVGSFLKSKMKEKMREGCVATSHCVFFFRKQM